MSVRVPIAELMSLPGTKRTRRGTEKWLKRIGALRVRRGLYQLDPVTLGRLSEAQRAELLKRQAPAISTVAPAESATLKVAGLDVGSSSAESARASLSTEVSLACAGAAARDSLRSCVAKAPLSKAQLDVADSRAELCNRFEDFRASAGATLKSALRRFANIYNAGEVVVSDETRARFPRRSAESIQRDWRAWRKFGAEALVPGHGNRHGDGIFEREPAMRELALAMIAHQPHVRVARIYEALRVRFPSRAPSMSTVRAFVAAWKAENPSLFLRLKNPDAWKQKFSLALGRADADIVRAGHHEIDGTRLEVQCTDGIFHLEAVVDVFTRKMVCTLSPSASAAATAALLRKSLVALGVPDEIKSDWGKEYLNARIERAMRRLDIRWHKVARPYAGELKPFIECGQGTVLHMFFEQCAGFKGHNVRQNAEIQARHSFQARRGEKRNLAKLYDVRLSSAQLSETLDQWLEHVYGNRPHAGLHGQTPNEVFRAAEARGEVKRVSDERALDLLLGEDGVAVVGSKGIRVSGAFFWGDALIGWTGRQVEWVRTRDAGKLLIFSGGDRPGFICVALDLASRGVDRQVVALAATARQKQAVREQLDELKRLKRQHRPENLLREVIDDAEKRALATLPAETPLVAALPYINDGLRAAAAALAALESRPTAAHDSEILQRGAALCDELERRQAKWPDMDEMAELYRAICDRTELPGWTDEYLARIGASADEWAKNFEGTPKYSAFLKLRRYADDATDVAQRAAMIAASDSSRRAKPSTYQVLADAAVDSSRRKVANSDG